VRQSDVIGRIGGDEFVALVLLENKNDQMVIKQRLQKGFLSARHSPNLPDYSVSIGIIDVDLNTDFVELLDKADQEMLKNKKPV
jgi:diguanylate cyclase (GGDEF)-like protein